MISRPSRSGSVLVCENDAEDLRAASSTVRSFGIDAIAAFDSSFKAQAFLEACLADAMPLPDLLIVDLDLQLESGYELVRFWRTTPALAKTPLIVWSVLGGDHARVCEVFKISRFVSKLKGNDALAEAIGEALL